MGGINISKLVLLIILFLAGFFGKDNNYTYVGNEIKIFDRRPVIERTFKEEAIEIYNGPITAYGPDCVGCYTGKTASGYNVLNGNIYYNDDEYGKVRIVAADKSIPFGSIIRIRNLDIFEENIYAIVLDRGSAIGFDKKVFFDLLYSSEKETLTFGRRNATFELLRRGY